MPLNHLIFQGIEPSYRDDDHHLTCTVQVVAKVRHGKHVVVEEIDSRDVLDFADINKPGVQSEITNEVRARANGRSTSTYWHIALVPF